MADVLTPLLAAASRWAHDAARRDWLAADAPRTLDDTVVATPGALFADGERPLVAALFGGTGVGKSALMNRLAGEPVARSSAERPTSRDVTLYAHRDVVIGALPDSLPTERVRTTLHGNEDWRDVLWLDMPDVDSVETANRELVMRWLPHVDALLYVVSPERYRDDEGWRLLLEHGARHAWLFVINHWDRGDERQFEDFRAMLVAAGLEAPLLFRTDCGPSAEATGTPDGDDFDALRTTLLELADARLAEQLEARGVLKRAAALRERTRTLHTQLGEIDELEALPGHWERQWTHEAATLGESLGWRADTLAAEIAARGASSRSGNPLSRLLGREEPPVSTDTAIGPRTPAGHGLLDAEALAQIDDVLERLMQEISGTHTSGPDRTDRSAGLPLGVARRLFTPLRAEFAERLPRLVDDALAHSLAAPGGRWQRLAHRLCGALAGLLPLAALLWIGWRILDGFGRGGSDPTAYLGSDFAINSTLLLALSWALPMLLQRRLAPSRERAAARGLKAGLERAFEEVRLRVDERLDTALRERREIESAYEALWSAAPTALPGADPAGTDAALPERVRRMLFDGVRASTHSSTDAAPVS